MIKLYQFKPAFGLPNASPFCMKVETYLRMAGLPYECPRGADLRKAPKGKLPYIDDDGTIVADSTLIRMHLERRHGIDFDKALSPEQKGTAWAVEKMLEDHLYWLVVMDRWLDRENFEKGPRHFFDKLPAVMRPVIIAMVGRQVRRTLHGQGLGRHSPEERARLGRRAVDALAAHLGDKPWLMGPEPCGADATGVAFTAHALAPLFRGPMRDAVSAHANLVAYADRGMKRWYADFEGA